MHKPKNIQFAFILLVIIVHAEILSPQTFQDKMYTSIISGDLQPLEPTYYVISPLWPLPVEVYQISMMRSKHQFLPDGMPSTQVFAYAKKENGKFIPQFPGPYIQALKNMPTYIIWSNNIQGTHFLPVDQTIPFQMVEKFMNEVPVVPHLHGLQTQTGSDGQPLGFWTKSGRKGDDYYSITSKYKLENQAIFRYHNTKQGLLWYHDHVMGITRLNVYAGLVGYYQIFDSQISIQQNNLLKYYGNLERKHFIIADKSFQTDGNLYYPKQSASQNHTYWVPQFFGNTMTVNGKVWPKVILEPKKYRIVFLNGCQSRYLKIYFQNKGKRLDFQIFRRDSDFLRKPLKMNEHLLLIGGRVQIFIDLTKVKGQVILKNSAVAPQPMGQKPYKYTSQILKIVILKPINKEKKISNTILNAIKNRLTLYKEKQGEMKNRDYFDFMDTPQIINFKSSHNKAKIGHGHQKLIAIKDFKDCNYPGSQKVLFNDQNFYKNKKVTIKNNIKQILGLLANSDYKYFQDKNIIINDAPYPRFEEGTPFFTVLTEVNDEKQEVYSTMIDGVSLSKECQGSTFKQGKVYQFFIINLTGDDHPIHIHLVNFQVIGRFQFDHQQYGKDWRTKNGKVKPGGLEKIPEQIDVRTYRTSDIQPPAQQQKQFLDIIKVSHHKVTIARVKFSNQFGKPFPFEVQNAKYVWHCHILEHEDNEMMRYYCIE